MILCSFSYELQLTCHNHYLHIYPSQRIWMPLISWLPNCISTLFYSTQFFPHVTSTPWANLPALVFPKYIDLPRACLRLFADFSIAHNKKRITHWVKTFPCCSLPSTSVFSLTLARSVFSHLASSWAEYAPWIHVHFPGCCSFCLEYSLSPCCLRNMYLSSEFKWINHWKLLQSDVFPLSIFGLCVELCYQHLLNYYFIFV